MIDALLLLAELGAFLLLLLAVSRPAGGRENLGVFAFRDAPHKERAGDATKGGAGAPGQEGGDA